ncbi:MAG: helix-turn-helix domain-containing protein [Patescibacteria group bacterium]
MTGFITKKIDCIQTLGEKLQKHRHEKGLSLEKAARAINTNVIYLKLFERNDYQKLPADIYAINILKHYSNLLNLNPATVIDLFKKEKTLFLKTRKKPTLQALTNFQKLLNKFLNPKTLKYFIILLLLAAVFSYIGKAINKIVSPPLLVVNQPAENLITLENQITIQGYSEKEVSLKINDRPLLSDKQGGFNLTIDLQKGLNIIKISAQKKHSKEQVVYRKIIVSETPIELTDK